MRVLVVGGGGREHALVDRLAREAPEARLFAAPGNPGIGARAAAVPVAANDLEGLEALARERRVDLAVVGPEAPLAAGIADRFEAAGLPLFGPSAAAARIEASKAFAKRLMRERGVPTADFEVFEGAEDARDYVASAPVPLVVKASGLAAGKGAIVCRSREEARAAVDTLMVERRFGTAGDEVVIEAFLQGVELSAFFLCDGEDAFPLVPSRDYKRAGEGDAGPNTGGMGAYAPAGAARISPPPGGPAGADETAAVLEVVRRRIALPVLEGLAERGAPYRGFLYAGLMLTEDGPQVIEFNCRLGDPEAQVVLPLTRAELLGPMAAIARGERLGRWEAGRPRGAALVTVLASDGYPEAYETGRPIRIPAELESDERRIYHAGTALRNGTLVTAGGRVLGVVGLGGDLKAAAVRSREGAEAIDFEGKRWRRDIGWHAGVSALPEPEEVAERTAAVPRTGSANE